MPSPKLSAGDFGAWLRALEASGRTGAGMPVECGACRGCCTSSYFIHIGPDETETLARIPKRLLFPAPGMPKGHFLLGYDGKGHCPMFKDDACSIYADRPRTCRAYDCRIFAATGLAEADKPAISRQAERWRFGFPSAEDERRFRAVRAAARFLRRHADAFPPGFVPGNATRQAALAIRVHAVFLEPGRDVAETAAAILRSAGITPDGGAPRPDAGSHRKPAARRRSGRSG
jgi:Fe-S-cluster containining protein